MKLLTIGKVAKLAKVGVETVRFYEREGLIEKPPRKEPGYRQYSENTVRKLRFIRHAKKLGFILKEIKEFLTLRLNPEATCEDIRTRAEVKIDNIEKKIQTLLKMKHALEKLTMACNGNGPINECPILEAMEDDKL